MAHEHSVTTRGADGSWWNIPSVIGDVSVTPKLAETLFHGGYIKPLEGPFRTLEIAERAAWERSRGESRPLPDAHLYDSPQKNKLRQYHKALRNSLMGGIGQRPSLLSNNQGVYPEN